MKRGEIWWADLAEPSGSEPGYRRPVLVVQADPFNASRISTVVAAALTKTLRLADAPGNVLLTTRETSLPHDSVVNVSQLYTIDKAFLLEQVSRLKPAQMEAINDGLRLVLGL